MRVWIPQLCAGHAVIWSRKTPLSHKEPSCFFLLHVFLPLSLFFILGLFFTALRSGLSTQILWWFVAFFFLLPSPGVCLKDNSICSQSPTQACLSSFPLSAKTVNCQVQGSAFSHIILSICITLSWSPLIVLLFNCLFSTQSIPDDSSCMIQS